MQKASLRKLELLDQLRQQSVSLRDVVRESHVEEKVLVITQDGRTIVGQLEGFDQTINVILSSSIERVYSLDEPVEEVPLGLYVVRGDNIVAIGEMDPELEQQEDLTTIRADPLPEATH